MIRAMLGVNQYGKAETHLVRVDRDGDVHELRDLLVSVALSGGFEAVHLRATTARCSRPTRRRTRSTRSRRSSGSGRRRRSRCAWRDHFVGGAITRARVQVVEAAWSRLGDHAFVQSARESRIAVAICSGDAAWFVSGLSDLVVLKTTDSEFHGFPRDRYTTLAGDVRPGAGDRGLGALAPLR